MKAYVSMAPEVMLASSDIRLGTTLPSWIFHSPAVFLDLKNSAVFSHLSYPGKHNYKHNLPPSSSRWQQFSWKQENC